MADTTKKGVRIPKKMESEIKDLVEEGSYMSVSDFIRSAIRDKLESSNDD